MMADSAKRDRATGPNKHRRRGHAHHHRDKKDAREGGSTSDAVEMTPALKMFKACQTELDCKHDKYERLVKISRDITIESKRVIFLLHRIEGDPQEVLEEAETRLKMLQDNLISKIAHELKGEDLHQFLRSFSPGMQEYVEAVAFYLFIKENRLVSMEEVASRLTFPAEQDEQQSKQDKLQDNKDEGLTPTCSSDADRCKEPAESSGHTAEPSASDGRPESERTDDDPPPPRVSLCLPLLEVMLGLADFTGELMRLCINTVGGGDLERPFRLLPFMRSVHEGFQSLGNLAGREMVRKSSVMRQSLKKMEDACYVITVRGSEIPKHMLKDALTIPSECSAGSRDGEYD